MPAEKFSNSIDAPWKRMLSHFFQPFIELCLPTIEAQIDWEKGYENLNKDFEKMSHSSKTGKRLLDMLIKVTMLDGHQKLILIHLEIQAQKQNDFPQRMYTYNYKVYDKYQLPVVSIALLLDEDPSWRPNSFEMEDPFLKVPYLVFKYHVVKLLDFSTQREALINNKNIFAKIVRIQLSALETQQNLFQRLHDKIELDTELLKSELTEEEISQLKIFLDWILLLPEELMMTYTEQIKEIEKEFGVTFVSSAERVGVIKGLREGHQKGLQKGLQEGRQEGRQEGHQEGMRNMLDRQSDVAFLAM